MPTFTCNLNQLIQNSACFRRNCMSDSDRIAIDIYFKVKNLAAIGGTNYTTNLAQLLKDSSPWQWRAPDELQAVDLWIDMQNAINDGAVINTNVNALALAAKCNDINCMGRKITRGIQSFLKCAINTNIRPD